MPVVAAFKKKWVWVAAILALFVATLVVGFSSAAKRVVPSDAIKIVSVEVMPQPDSIVKSGGCVATSTIILSNTTAKGITVKFLYIEAGSGIWTNTEAGNFKAVPFAIAPNGLGYEYPRFLKTLPLPPWRFRLSVCEELKGAERGLLAAEIGTQRIVHRIQGRSFWSPFVNGTIYYGHKTEMLVGEDQKWPILRRAW